MQKEKNKKLTNILMWTLLAVVILFVIISSCVVKSKEDRLNDVTNKNQQIEDKLDENVDQEDAVLKIF